MSKVTDFVNDIIAKIDNEFEVKNASNGSWYPSDIVPFCSRIQTYSIKNVILIWDIILVVPNVLFAVFLLLKWFLVRVKLRAINFPILTIFYNLILIISLLSIMRCIVTILIKPTTHIGSILNKIVWLIVRFSQLSTELSVVFFGLFFARLDSHKTIMRIMGLTIPISLIYISIQACMELFFPDKHYIVIDNQNHYYDLYGHGGMIFWFISSSLFAMIYLVIFLLPHTNCKRKFQIPAKKSFYTYCLILAIVCLIQSIGSAFVYSNYDNSGVGMCILDFTTFLYFTMFGPLVYVVFLGRFFQKESMFPNRYLIKDNDSSFDSSGNVNNNEGINYGYDDVAIISGSRKSIIQTALTNNSYGQDTTSPANNTQLATSSYNESNLIVDKDFPLSFQDSEKFESLDSIIKYNQMQKQHQRQLTLQHHHLENHRSYDDTNRDDSYTHSILISARNSLKELKSNTIKPASNLKQTQQHHTWTTTQNATIHEYNLDESDDNDTTCIIPKNSSK